MRLLLIYIFFGVALWYFGRAAMRHYLASPQRTNTKGREGDSGSVRNRGHGNYESARDVRYRDLE